MVTLVHLCFMSLCHFPDSIPVLFLTECCTRPSGQRLPQSAYVRMWAARLKQTSTLCPCAHRILTCMHSTHALMGIFTNKSCNAVTFDPVGLGCGFLNKITSYKRLIDHASSRVVPDQLGAFYGAKLMWHYPWTIMLLFPPVFVLVCETISSCAYFLCTTTISCVQK